MKLDKKFWIRFTIWTLFSCIIPFAFIVWRFDLFKSVSKLQIGGWGMIGILIVCIFAIVLAKYVKQGMVKWSMTKQIISGLVKVIIPIVSLILILYSIKDNIDVFIQSMCAVAFCELIAIPINPMPEWVYEQSKGETEDAIDYFFKRQDDYQKGKTQDGGTK